MHIRSVIYGKKEERILLKGDGMVAFRLVCYEMTWTYDIEKKDRIPPKNPSKNKKLITNNVKFMRICDKYRNEAELTYVFWMSVNIFTNAYFSFKDEKKD